MDAMSDFQAQQAVFVAIASFTVLCWDHIITFSDEVALIWCKRKGLLGYLFLLNRYMTPLGFVVNIVALTLPAWSRERYFVRYEGAMATIGIGIAQLVMLLRVYGLCPGRRLATAIPALLFLTWLVLQAFLMAHGEMIRTTQEVYSCREVYDAPLALSATRAWLPLAYDTAIFVMTIWCTLPSIRNSEIGRIRPTLLFDGALYYIIICSVNLVLTVMIVRAPSTLKGASSQLAFLLTVVMTSRVTLNLKKQAEGGLVTTPPRIYQQHPCSIHCPSRIKAPSALGHCQVHVSPADNLSPHLRSRCSWYSTIFPSTPTPIMIDAGHMDDAQYFLDKVPVNETYADVESAHYEHDFAQ